MTRLEKVKKFLSDNNYNGTEVYKTPNTAGDIMVPVYQKDGIEILYCYIYNYLEIFNLTDEEYDQITEPDIFCRIIKTDL